MPPCPVPLAASINETSGGIVHVVFFVRKGVLFGWIQIVMASEVLFVFQVFADESFVFS